MSMTRDKDGFPILLADDVPDKFIAPTKSPKPTPDSGSTATSPSAKLSDKLKRKNKKNIHIHLGDDQEEVVLKLKIDKKGRVDVKPDGEAETPD